MKKTNNRKWLYLVGGILVVALIGLAIGQGYSGEFFQGKSFRTSQVKVDKSQGQDKSKNNKGNNKNNPTDLECDTIYGYLQLYGASALSTWMQNTGQSSMPQVTQQDVEYCRDNVIGINRWFWQPPSNTVCNDMYYYMRQNGTSALSTWMQNTGWSTKPQLVLEDALYCRDNVIGANRWFWQPPSNTVCNDMYYYMRQNGTSALSTWMQNTGWSTKPQLVLEDALYCRDNVIGRDTWFSGYVVGAYKL